MPTSLQNTRTALVAACACLALALSGCDAGSDELLLARAAGHELTVDETVRAITPAIRVPAEAGVVETVADLWIDYTLLAEAMAEDSTLSHLDLGPLVRQQTEVETILALRDSLISADTVVTDAEIEAFYQDESAGREARASHILVAFPQGATAEQRDSVRAVAAEIRRQIAEGADFAEMARRYSQDPGTARQGGDLGWFPRGQMVRSFDRAVFSMEAGEVSDPVETPYGYHLIRVEEMRAPELEEVRDQIRSALQQRRTLTAESTFVAGVMAEADVQVAESGFDVTRQMARNPRTDLSGRASRRAVARYEGGDVTVGEVRDFMLTRQPNYRNQLVDLPDSTVEDVVIHDLVRKELLLEEAASRGIEMSEQEVDSLTDLARDRFIRAARALRIASIDVQPGESRQEAIHRTVMGRIQAMVRGTMEVVPVGAIGFVLRRHYPSELYSPVGVERVVQGVESARRAQQGGSGGVAPPQPGGAVPGGAGSGGPPAGQPGASPAPSEGAGG